MNIIAIGSLILCFFVFCGNLVASIDMEKAIADRYGHDCGTYELGSKYRRILSQDHQYRRVVLSTGKRVAVYFDGELHTLGLDDESIKHLSKLFYDSPYRTPRNADDLIEICEIINGLLLSKIGMIGDLRIQYLLNVSESQWGIADEELFVEFKSLFYLPYFRLFADNTWEMHFLHYNEDGSLNEWAIRGGSEKILIDEISVKQLLKPGSFELEHF